MNLPVLSSPATEASGLDPARCPLCGGANECQRCTSEPYKGPCWCERLTFPDELAARIPADARGRACVCSACVLAALRARPLPRAGVGDFYLEPTTGRMVFTAAYHRRRGYCCGSGCRHCPWSPDQIASHPVVSVMGGILLGMVLLLGGTPVRAETWVEDFSADPFTRGWQAVGETNRFSWNAAAGQLEVTWDTAGAHSYFAHPLKAPLTGADDFSLTFDLHLTSAQGGVREGRPGAMQVAVGLLNLSRARAQNYARGAGKAFETVEFNWFPEGFIPGFGLVEPTLSAITFDAAGRVAANFSFPYELTFHSPHRIKLTHEAVPRTLKVEVTGSGIGESTVILNLPETFGSFALDAVAILIWDERTSFSDSLQASGSVDNIVVVLPDPPIGSLQILASGREIEFTSQIGWRYFLDASLELGHWQPLGEAVRGTGKTLRLFDNRKAAFPQQFYRVRAERE